MLTWTKIFSIRKSGPRQNIGDRNLSESSIGVTIGAFQQNEQGSDFMSITSDSKKRALIVVDVQNDFCPGGALAVDRGDEVVAPLNELIDQFLQRGEPVFKSRDWHPEKTKHFAAYGGSWPVHCVQNTRGADFHPDLLDDIHIRVISKGLGDTDCYSAFDETDLDLQLRRLGVEEVWVGGLATDYCVKNTVIDALKKGYKVKALKDAMRAVNLQPGDEKRALDEMRAAGATISEAQGQEQEAGTGAGGR
jgi:nicotinamidase/pyrazinamidase